MPESTRQSLGRFDGFIATLCVWIDFVCYIVQVTCFLLIDLFGACRMTPPLSLRTRLDGMNIEFRERASALGARS